SSCAWANSNHINIPKWHAKRVATPRYGGLCWELASEWPSSRSETEVVGPLQYSWLAAREDYCISQFLQ
ncbi:MAG TPA: hypothetical protein VH593_11660, partial [Ktedonobacteraceae bacterium]